MISGSTLSASTFYKGEPAHTADTDGNHSTGQPIWWNWPNENWT
jgi:hypothetical protein